MLLQLIVAKAFKHFKLFLSDVILLFFAVKAELFDIVPVDL